MIEIDYTKDADPATPGEKAMYFAVLGLVTAGFAADVMTEYHPMKLSALFFFLAWAPLTVIHELGHAVVAKAVGWEVREFVIGYGKVLKEFDLHGTKVQFRMFPFSGYVLPHHEEGCWSRARGAMVYFAGSGVELFVFVLVYLFLGVGRFTEPSEDHMRIMMQGIGLGAATGAVLNLLPHSAMTDKGVVPNDGLGILISLFGREPDDA